MKFMIALVITTFTISAFANDCTITTKSRVKGIPVIAFQSETSVVDAVDLQECVELAKDELGRTYTSRIRISGGIDSPSGYIKATFKVRKVKYSFTQDGITYTGKIR